jgi:hypothetical protein
LSVFFFKKGNAQCKPRNKDPMNPLYSNQTLAIVIPDPSPGGQVCRKATGSLQFMGSAA